MKEWKKPFVKVVVLDSLLTDTVCSSPRDFDNTAEGQGATVSSQSLIWDH